MSVSENWLGSGEVTWYFAGFNIALKNNIEVKVNGKKYNGEFLYPNTKYNIKIKNK